MKALHYYVLIMLCFSFTSAQAQNPEKFAEEMIRWSFGKNPNPPVDKTTKEALFATFKYCPPLLKLDGVKQFNKIRIWDWTDRPIVIPNMKKYSYWVDVDVKNFDVFFPEDNRPQKKDRPFGDTFGFVIDIFYPIGGSLSDGGALTIDSAFGQIFCGYPATEGPRRIRYYKLPFDPNKIPYKYPDEYYEENSKIK